MESVDDAAKKYLAELLSPDRQENITSALKKYMAGESTA